MNKTRHPNGIETKEILKKKHCDFKRENHKKSSNIS